MSTQYNGGISLAVGAVSIPTVTSYSPQWETVSESFTEHDMSTYTMYSGDRFSVSVTTGIMSYDDMVALRRALLAHEFDLVCPEFSEGIRVRLTSLSQPLEVANYGRKFYRLSFAVVAVALVNGNGL